MQLILGANVFVSAALSSEGSCADLVRARRQGRVDILLSPKLMTEMRRTLSRAKFRKHLSDQEVEDFVEEMAGLCRTVADPVSAARYVRDPDDDYLVALAIAENVDAVVSGDKDPLVLDPSIVRVLTAREALREVYR